MSWIDQLRDDLIIVTGDGREFRPLWKATEKIIEFNYSQFEFPGVRGSMVSRGEVKGRRFPLEIYFVGEEHIAECDMFEVSSYDKRHWVVTHPYYGVLNVKPASINIDHSGGNVSKIGLNLLETIVENNPKGIDRPEDKIITDVETFSFTINEVVVSRIPSPNTLEKNTMSGNVTKIYNEGRKKIKDTTDAENYLNLFNNASNAILNATDDVAQAMTEVQAMINAPFQFADTVKNRVNMLRNQLVQLTSSAENILELFVSSHQKLLYEHDASLILATMAAASVTNIDYQSAEDVLDVIDVLTASFSKFISDIDTLQTETGGDPDSYIPNADGIIQIQSIVNYTISKLMEIALESKQERSIVLDVDSNVIILAHRFYGLQPDDSTIDYLIDTNNFGANDMIQIPAGRTIKYYV